MGNKKLTETEKKCEGDIQCNKTGDRKSRAKPPVAVVGVGPHFMIYSAELHSIICLYTPH